MRKHTGSSWWGLYILVPFGGGLLYAVAVAPVTEEARLLLLAGIVVAITGLALRWTESHADLMGSQGADALAEEQSLAANSVAPGRLAPSLTGRQAHYRQIMLARRADECGQAAQPMKDR